MNGWAKQLVPPVFMLSRISLQVEANWRERAYVVHL